MHIRGVSSKTSTIVRLVQVTSGISGHVCLQTLTDTHRWVDGRSLITMHEEYVSTNQFFTASRADMGVLGLWKSSCINNRLMHALFHIRTVIIPGNRYRTEGFSPRVDVGWEMITALIWKKACINLFITYFNVELKRTKLTSHRHTKLVDMIDRYRLRDDNYPDMEKGMHWPNYHIFQHWIKITKLALRVGRKWHHGPHERLDIVLSEFCSDGLISRWHFRCLRMGKIDVIAYKYAIIFI